MSLGDRVGYPGYSATRVSSITSWCKANTGCATTHSSQTAIYVGSPAGTRPALSRCMNNMTILRESTTEQLHARATLEHHLATFVSLTGRPRRLVAQQIRALVVTFSWLGDLIPDDVWRMVYRVPAIGTVQLPKDIPQAGETAAVSGKVDQDETDLDQTVDIARGTERPESQQIAKLLEASKQHRALMISQAHQRVMDEIDGLIGCLTRADYDAVLDQVVRSIATRRPQRDDG